MNDAATRDDTAHGLVELLEERVAKLVAEIAAARAEGRVTFDRGTTIIHLAQEVEAAFS